MKTSSKMLVDAGVVPKDAVQQMESWGTLPSGASNSHGAKKIMIQDQKAQEFGQELKSEVESDLQEIRETEFSPTRPISVVVGIGGDVSKVMASVDQLGRVHLPFRRQFENATTIRIGDEAASKITKIEPRFLNDKPVSWVCYLDNVYWG